MDSESVERLRERLLQCAICMEEFRDPRLLPCHHTFCYECIQKVVQASNISRFFKCPQCRSDACLPRGGIKDLPINFYIISLQDELGSSGYTGSCDVCNRDWLATQFRCIDCDLDICRFCIHSHRLDTHTDNPPKILRVESPSSSPNQLTSHHHCHDHPDETVQLFCKSCNQAICISCSFNSHKKHSLISLSAKLHESQAYLQAELDKLTGERRKAVQAWKELEKARASVVDASNRSMLAVDAQAHKVCKVIMNKKIQIVKEILMSEKRQTDDIDCVLKDFKSYLQKIERGLSFLSDLQESDVCLEVVEAYKDFSGKLSDARKEFVSNCTCLEQHQFIPSNWNKIYVAKFGLSRRFYHAGGLGSMSRKRLSLSIHPKTLEVSLRRSTIARVIESSLFKQLFIFFVAFLFFQFLFFVADATGLLGIVSECFFGSLAQISSVWQCALDQLYQI